MLIVEHLTPHTGHSHAPPTLLSPAAPSGGVHLSTPSEIFDVDLEDMHRVANSAISHTRMDSMARIEQQIAAEASKAKVVPLTFGLFVHGLADGLALGVSSLSNNDNDLSLVVFFALLIHKGQKSRFIKSRGYQLIGRHVAPTTLALSTSLLASNLPRATCKKHIAIFASSTPLGALLSFFFFTLLQSSEPSSGDWTGVALLVSGGTFLYVATVLQSVSEHQGGGGAGREEMSKAVRLGLIILGIFLPFVIGALLGHGHEHGGGGHGHSEHVASSLITRLWS